MLPETPKLQGSVELKSPIFQHNCQYCSFATNSSKKLLIHEKIHTQGRVFKCPICSQTFSRKNSVSRHLLIHTGEKPFKCDICGKSYNHSQTLKYHRTTHFFPK